MCTIAGVIGSIAATAASAATAVTGAVASVAAISVAGTTVGAIVSTVTTVLTVASVGLTVAGAITGDKSLLDAAMWVGIGAGVGGAFGAAASAGATAGAVASTAGDSIGAAASDAIGTAGGGTLGLTGDTASLTASNAVLDGATASTGLGTLGKAGTAALNEAVPAATTGTGTVGLASVGASSTPSVLKTAVNPLVNAADTAPVSAATPTANASANIIAPNVGQAGIGTASDVGLSGLNQAGIGSNASLGIGDTVSSWYNSLKGTASDLIGSPGTSTVGNAAGTVGNTGGSGLLGFVQNNPELIKAGSQVLGGISQAGNQADALAQQQAYNQQYLNNQWVVKPPTSSAKWAVNTKGQLVAANG